MKGTLFSNVINYSVTSIELGYSNVINYSKLSVLKAQMPANKGYQVTVECQNDCGMWTDIRVYTLEMKAQTELLDFTCGFCAAKEMKLKKQIESYEKASEKLEVTQSLDKIKETNQSSSNAVPSKLSFA